MPELPGITDTQKALGGVVGGGVQVASDPTGNAIGLQGLRLNTANPYAFMPDGQPFGITKPVLEAGKFLMNSATPAGGIFSDPTKWTTISGTPTLSSVTGFDASGNITGIVSRTGQPNLMKVTAGSAQDVIRIPAANMTAINIGGKLCLAVYIDVLPGYQTGGSVTSSIVVTLSTTSDSAGSIEWNFNSNQLREGWNFLKAVKAGIPTSNSDTEAHFLGTTETIFTFANADLFNRTVTAVKLTLNNFNVGGTNLYFDSISTGWNHKPQVVLGCDANGTDLVSYAKPIFDAYGWLGYVAMPRRVSNPSYAMVGDWMNTPADSNTIARGKAMYAAGWDCINHTMNHNRLGDYTDPALIRSEVLSVNQWYEANGMTRGLEFYASPQSSTSRMSQLVIQNCGIKLQRHAIKQNTSVTPWGVDNPQYLGAIDIGNRTSWQAASKVKAHIDMLIRYGDTGFLFWHVITQLGDPGTGEGVSADDLTVYYSNFKAVMDYIRAKEQTGALTVCRGLTGFYYGI